MAIKGVKAVIVAVDGQPSEPFEPLLNQFPIGPGARFELIFDMQRDPGADVRHDLPGAAGDEDLPPSRPRASRSPPGRSRHGGLAMSVGRREFSDTEPDPRAFLRATQCFQGLKLHFLQLDSITAAGPMTTVFAVG